MADNTELNEGSGGDTIAADDVGGIKHQRVKIEYGTDGSATDVSDSNPLPVDDAGGTLTVDDGGTTLSVDDGGGSVTVDGTVAVSGTVTVDGSGVTQPVSHAALTELAAAIDTELQVDVVGPLPAGTNAIGKLAANSGVDIGDVDVLTVPTDPFGANADAASATGSISAKLRFIAATGIPVTGTVTVASHAVTNAGTFPVQVDGSALTALQKIDDPVLVDDAGFTPATSSVMMAGFQADESSTDSVDEGDAGAGRMTLDRKQIVNPQPHTAGGCSIFRSLDLDETEEDVKTSAGQIYGWFITNRAATPRYLKFYNATAANVSVGSTTPVMTFDLPASSTHVSGNSLGAMGIAFDTAICVAATTGLADSDTGAPDANDVVVNLFYK